MAAFEIILGGCVLAVAAAISLVCGVGLLVWLAGEPPGPARKE
jgi:hypothetical protein